MTRHSSTPGAAAGRPGVRRRALSNHAIPAMAIACTAALLGGLGCGGDASSGPPGGGPGGPGGGGGGGGGPPPDAPLMPPPDAPHTPPPDASPDAPPGSGGIVSNTPGATVVDIGVPATPTLALLSSNLLQEPSGSQQFQQWLAEVQNNGTTLSCLLSVDVSFQRADGGQLASFTSFVSADPYLSDGLSVTMPCLAPGQIGTFYANGFAAAAIALADVARIAVQFHPNDFPGVPALDAPIVTSQVAPVFDGFGLTGMFTGQVGPIHNIELDAYPRDAGGLVLGQLFAVDLGTLQPGATFAFSTLGVSADFTQYRQFPDFIDGLPSTVQAPATRPASAQEAAAAALDAARRAERAAVQGRARRAHGR